MFAFPEPLCTMPPPTVTTSACLLWWAPGPASMTWTSEAALLCTTRRPLTQTESESFWETQFLKGGGGYMGGRLCLRASSTDGSLFCLQVPGIFTAKWCKSRDPGQSGLQCCALRLSIWAPPLSGAGENLSALLKSEILVCWNVHLHTAAFSNLYYRLPLKHL